MSDKVKYVEDGEEKERNSVEALPLTSDIDTQHRHTASRQYADQSTHLERDMEMTGLVAICVVTTVLVATVLLVTVSCTWKRFQHQNMSLQTDFTCEAQHQVVDGCDEEEEAEGLLIDTADTLLADVSFRLHSRLLPVSQGVHRVQVVGASGKYNDIELTRISPVLNPPKHSSTTGQHADSSWDETDAEVGQMEWDPQTDVASPMLPIHTLDGWQWHTTP